MSARNKIGTRTATRTVPSSTVFFLPTKVARWGALAFMALGLSVATPALGKDVKTGTFTAANGLKLAVEVEAKRNGYGI